MKAGINNRDQGHKELAVDEQFVLATHRILPAVIPENPRHKEQVGTVIYDFVVKIVGVENAPKITGMMLELPVTEMQAILKDWNLFNTRLHQAKEILEGHQQKIAAKKWTWHSP